MSGADDRAARLLGGEALAGLRKRLRRRFERAAPGQAGDSFRIGDLTPEEHSALAALTGRHPRFTGSLSVDLAGVDAAFRQAGIAGSLRDALERLDGPIVHRATEHDRVRMQWDEVVSRCRHPAFAEFLGSQAALGMVKRLARGEPGVASDLCEQAEAVLRLLPANGLARARLAAEVLGDAHGLDAGRPVATLVLAVWRRTAAAADEADMLALETVREVWARAGVLVNELARPALFLNLPGARDGEPGYVSLRRLVRSPPSWDVAGCIVYVCENPNLLAIMADQFGPRCPPMVCTEGMPAAAQNRLLSQLASAGARFFYHGDFDWAGLSIGNAMVGRYAACPWRFGAADYSAAIAAAARPGRLLEGAAVQASWDAALSATMRQHGLAIAEEAVAETLMRDMEEAAWG
jgi:uncharacterized protein (TIGR02679 family)